MIYDNLDSILTRTSDEVNNKIEYNIESYLIKKRAENRWTTTLRVVQLKKIYKIFNNLLKNNLIKSEEFLNIDQFINFDGNSQSFIVRDGVERDYIKIYPIWEENEIIGLDIKYNDKVSKTIFELERENELCKIFFDYKNFKRFEQTFINIINKILTKRDALLNELQEYFNKK